MSVIDTALKANEIGAKEYNSDLGRPPAPKIVIVTCTRGRHGASHSARRSFLATAAAAGAFVLVLLAVPSYAQTIPAAGAQASGTAAAEDTQLQRPGD